MVLWIINRTELYQIYQFKFGLGKFLFLQLSTSSLTIHGGAIFSAVSGRKSIPISAIEAPEHGAWYRLLGFCLTITFCLIPAHQAVSYWNCHWYWRISRLGDHKYLPFVTNPYEIKQANPLTNTAISKGNGLVCNYHTIKELEYHHRSIGRGIVCNHSSCQEQTGKGLRDQVFNETYFSSTKFQINRGRRTRQS